METGQALAPLSALQILAIVILSASGIIISYVDVVPRCADRITIDGRAALAKIIMKAF